MYDKTAFQSAVQNLYTDAPKFETFGGWSPTEYAANAPRAFSLALGQLTSGDMTEKTQTWLDEKNNEAALKLRDMDTFDQAFQAVGQASGFDTKYGLEPTFWSALGKMNAAMRAAGLGTFSISSGYRTIAQQAKLYKEKGPKWAAKPGKSKHNFGLAADLNMTSAQQRWIHANAGKFGLRFPMSYEPWHIQPKNIRS